MQKLTNRQTVLTKGSENAQGIVLHDVDVTDGDGRATLVISGYVDLYKFHHDTNTENFGSFKTTLGGVSYVAVDDLKDLNNYSRDVLFPAMKDAGEMEENYAKMREYANTLGQKLEDVEFNYLGNMIKSKEYTKPEELQAISGLEELHMKNRSNYKEINDLSSEKIKTKAYLASDDNIN